MARTIYTDTVLRAASELVTEADTPACDQNPEYDRAIVELTCDLLGINHDNRDVVLDILRAM
jgi:hypothetical protein